MVERRWEPPNAAMPRRQGRPPSNAAAAAAAAAASAASAAEGGVAAGRGRSQSSSVALAGASGFGDAATNGGIVTRGAPCEVRMEEEGLRGAYLGAHVLSAARLDGLVQVQYDTLYESIHKDTLLVEWVRPRDSDAVRPRPLAPTDGFHARLREGDAVEIWHEAGWWPVTVRAVGVGGHSFEVASEEFVALCRTYPSTLLRPRRKWTTNGWEVLTRTRVSEKAEPTARACESL
jgi:hypothetical protein